MSRDGRVELRYGLAVSNALIVANDPACIPWFAAVHDAPSVIRYMLIVSSGDRFLDQRLNVHVGLLADLLHPQIDES